MAKEKGKKANDERMKTKDEKALTIPDQYLRTGQWLLKSLKDRFPLQEADFNKHWLRSETGSRSE